jgi:hypothetical protein
VKVVDFVRVPERFWKYQGQEFQRIIWEEVTDCPDLETYKNWVAGLPRGS